MSEDKEKSTQTKSEIIGPGCKIDMNKHSVRLGILFFTTWVIMYKAAEINKTEIDKSDTTHIVAYIFLGASVMCIFVILWGLRKALPELKRAPSLSQFLGVLVLCILITWQGLRRTVSGLKRMPSLIQSISTILDNIFNSANKSFGSLMKCLKINREFFKKLPTAIINFIKQLTKSVFSSLIFLAKLAGFPISWLLSLNFFESPSPFFTTDFIVGFIWFCYLFLIMFKETKDEFWLLILPLFGIPALCYLCIGEYMRGVTLIVACIVIIPFGIMRRKLPGEFPW